VGANAKRRIQNTGWLILGLAGGGAPSRGRQGGLGIEPPGFGDF